MSCHKPFPALVFLKRHVFRKNCQRNDCAWNKIIDIKGYWLQKEPRQAAATDAEIFIGRLFVIIRQVMPACADFLWCKCCRNYWAESKIAPPWKPSPLSSVDALDPQWWTVLTVSEGKVVHSIHAYILRWSNLPALTSCFMRLIWAITWLLRDFRWSGWACRNEIRGQLSQGCSVTKLCSLLCDPMDWSTPGSCVPYYLPEFVYIHVH